MKAIMCKQFERRGFDNTVKTFEMFWKDQLVTPGDLIRMKESHREYRFSSVETDPVTGTTWINAHELPSFKIKSYHPGKIAGLIRKQYKNG